MRPTDTPHAAIVRALREAQVQPGDTTTAEYPMKIRLQDSGATVVRQEVVQRLGRLIPAAFAAALADGAPEGTVSDTHQQFMEEVKSLFAALIGAYPTLDEMSQMGAQ